VTLTADQLSAAHAAYGAEIARRKAIYTPGPTIKRFIDDVFRRALLRTANQIGKTRGAAKKMDNWCKANPDEVFGVLIADLKNHYAEVCVKIAEAITWDALSEDTTYSDGRGFYIHGKQGIKYKNGTRVLFRSGSGPVQGLESFTVGAGWIDEVPERRHYNAFVRGVHGPLWVTFTAIGRDPYWFRVKVEGDPETGEEPEEVWEQYVAVLSLEECPWKTQEEIDEMIAKTDPYERAQRLRGEWEGPTEARRFTAFTEDSITDEDLPEGAWSTIGIDHGEGAGKQFAVLITWTQTAVVISDEYVNPVATKPMADAKSIVAMLKRREVPYARVKRWLGDANSAGKGNVGESVNDMLGTALATCFGLPGRVGIEVPQKGKGSVELGEQIMNIAFEAQELKVHRRCVHLIRCLRHYQALGPRDPEKHGIDGARYGLFDVFCNMGRPSTRLYAGGMPTLTFGSWNG